MTKRVLCCDLGNVLVGFDDRPLKNLLKKNIQDGFLNFYLQHDAGSIELDDLWEVLNKSYFKEPVAWGDFLQVFASCISEMNKPLFYELLRFKEMGRGELVMISDNNLFCFYQTSLRFPEILELFSDGPDKPRWALSYKFKSLKRDVTLFNITCSRFGFSPNEAAFVDDNPINLEAAVKAGFDPEVCFLYKIKNKRNYRQFQKFLDKHFPSKF